MTSAAPVNRPTADSQKGLGHLELLASLILLLVGQSFLSGDSVVQRTLFNLLLLAIVLAAIRTLSKSKTRMITAVTTGIVGFVLSTYAEIHQSNALVTAIFSCYIIVFVLLILALAESVFADGPVDANRIVGAASIYLVMGLIFALVFSLLEANQPGAFQITPVSAEMGIRQDMVGELIYFSNVTLTTVGYGDINPVSRPAKTLAMLEAIIGQLYLAVVMARLVGLHIAQRQ